MKFLGIGFWALCLSSVVVGYPINSLKVGGQKEAEIRFQSSEAPANLPTPAIKGNSIELFFTGAELDGSFQGKAELKAPHALVKELTATQEKKGVSVKLEMIGKAGEWKDRVSVATENQSVVVRLGFPAKVTPALDYAQSEQLPILTEAAAVKPATSPFGRTQWFVVLGVLVVAALSTFAVVKLIQMKGKASGKRKYLIEQLAHCSLGPKTGVSLVRVGREFVLLGVTPQQVNLLSHVPALQAQYEEETRFERESFKDAVDEEITRLKKEIAL